jgi:hypothetical protein
MLRRTVRQASSVAGQDPALLVTQQLLIPEEFFGNATLASSANVGG